MEDLFDPDKPHFSAWLQLHYIVRAAESAGEFLSQRVVREVQR